MLLPPDLNHNNPVCPTDQKLLAQLSTGCKEAFRLIYDQHWEMLYQAAYSRLQDQELVEELLQELFVDLWTRHDRLAINTSIKAYLFTAVKYQVMKKIDSRRLHRSMGLEEVELPYDQYDVLELDDLYEQLHVAIDKLPQKSQLVFTMSRFDGLSTEEIADKLRLSPQTVHNKMSQSLRFLRSELKEYAPVIALLLVQ